MIKFNARTQVIVSEDLEHAVLEIIETEKPKAAGIIVDKNVSHLSEVHNLLETLNKNVSIFPKVLAISEPTTEMVDETAALFRDKNIELFIGIGGGSTMDLIKAVSVMVVNDGSISEYHGTGKLVENGTKTIMIPTTAGTGSEVTPGAVLLNEKTKFKRALSGECITPDYAVLCATLTISMPDTVMAATGMDAIAHAVESYTAKNSNLITQMYSKEAFRLVFNNLKKSFKNKNNLKLRSKIQLGACLAGFAIFNSNTGACHSMAYPLGIYHRIPHGVAVGLMLDKIVKINIEKGCLLYKDLLPLVEGEDGTETPANSAWRFHELLATYEPISHIGKTFKDYGVSQDDYEFLAERGLDLKSAISNNPVDFDVDDARSVLAQLT